MITTYFTFPILDCSPLFPIGFRLILVLECGHLILCIFVKSKTDFYAFLLILVWLIRPFVNYLCSPLFMNNLTMDPSLNLIFKDHALSSF